MDLRRPGLLTLLLSIFCIVVPNYGISQSTNPSNLLSSSVVAFAGGRSAVSVSLSGTIIKKGAIEDSFGTFDLLASTDGSATLTLRLNDGTIVESQTANYSAPTCTWTSADGEVHDGAPHNCIQLGPWFLPHVALVRALQDGTFTADSIGSSSYAGIIVEGLRLKRNVNSKSRSNPVLMRQTECEFLLASDTALPIVTERRSTLTIMPIWTFHS